MEISTSSLLERWWFLTKDGFDEFKKGKIGQGYEIISRHSGFLIPSISMADEELFNAQRLLGYTDRDAKQSVSWMQSPEQATNPFMAPTWKGLKGMAVYSFLGLFKHDLFRLGLFEPCIIGSKEVTFDCTKGSPSLLNAIQTGIVLARVLDRNLESDKEESVHVPKSFLSFSISPSNPDIVTLWIHDLLNHLVERLGVEPRLINRKHVVASIRTFLERDAAYKKHRKQRLQAVKRSSQIPKAISPKSIACACIATDWLRSGRNLNSLKTTVAELLAGIKIEHSDDWKNDTRLLRELHARVRLLPSTQLSTKSSLGSTDVDVASVLYSK